MYGKTIAKTHKTAGKRWKDQNEEVSLRVDGSTN